MDGPGPGAYSPRMTQSTTPRCAPIGGKFGRAVQRPAIEFGGPGPGPRPLHEQSCVLCILGLSHESALTAGPSFFPGAGAYRDKKLSAGVSPRSATCTFGKAKTYRGEQPCYIRPLSYAIS